MAFKTRTSSRSIPFAISSDSEDESKENNVPNDVNMMKISGDQTPERSSPSPLRKRTAMSAGSVKKRMQISSDDEDENSMYTPGDTRNKASAEKIKRNLALDKLKVKRESSAKRKVSAQADLADPTQSSLKENDKVNKVDVLKSQIDEDYSSSDDFEEHCFPQRRVGCKRLKSNYSPEDDESSQSSEQGSDSDDDDMEDFIVHDSAEDLDSQEIVEGGGVFFHLKPTLEEAHAIYVQVVLKSLLEDDSSENESDACFEQAKIVVEEKLWSKKMLVDSMAWGSDFREMLGRCSVLEDTCTLLLRPMVAKCQACKRNRDITRHFSFYTEPHGDIVQEFRIGRFCADKASLYHELHHYCSFTIKKKCIEKLEEVQGMESEMSAEDIVQRLCMEDEEWMNELFSSFQDLLHKADQWTTDGKKYKEMMGVVSSYM